MSNVLTDRTKVLPLLVVMAVIAVGATLIILLTGGPSTSASTAGAASGGGSSKVTIAQYKYAPAKLTVKAGTKVSWTNKDSSSHTATSGNYDTGTIKQGETKSITFKKPGTYKYICGFHPFMHGTVVVK